MLWAGEGRGGAQSSSTLSAEDCEVVGRLSHKRELRHYYSTSLRCSMSPVAYMITICGHCSEQKMKHLLIQALHAHGLPDLHEVVAYGLDLLHVSPHLVV